MSTRESSQGLDSARRRIAEKVRELRLGRGWTQAELAGRLSLSQNRLSEIERGAGSFTAEQLLEILRIFNVDVTWFAPSASSASVLQNALARLGAVQLLESEDVLPSERLSTVGDVVRETLVDPRHPRLVTALAPVLVRNIDSANLSKIAVELAAGGLGRRFAWLIENTLEAVRLESGRSPPARWGLLYRRAESVFLGFLSSITLEQRLRWSEAADDILDPTIRSLRTLNEVTAARSAQSANWGIVTSLTPGDFAAALRGAREAG